MSSDSRSQLMDAVGEAVMKWQDATQTFDEEVGRIYRLSAAERLALSLLWSGPQTASAIARHIRLTPATVTALIDRLEARGLVRRLADPKDRRKVIVSATEQAQQLASDVYQPVGEAGRAMLEGYSEAELQLALRFLEEARAVQEAMTDALLARQG